jgi:hypothetical protein
MITWKIARLNFRRGARAHATTSRIGQIVAIKRTTTGGNFARTAGFTVTLMGAGTKTTGAVPRDQPRTLDIGSRHGRKLESVPRAILDDVLAKLAAILE